MRVQVVIRGPGRPPKYPENVRRIVVLDAAVSRFAEVGLARATIDEIALAAGVRKPAIYELFGSKDDLFRAAVNREADALSALFRIVNAESLDLPRRDRTLHRVDAALAYAEENPQTFRLLARAGSSWPEDDPRGARTLRDRLVGVISDNYRRESKAAGKPIDAAADLLAMLFFTMTDRIIQLRLTDPTWERATLVNFLADFINGGISGVRPEVWVAIERTRSASEISS